MSRENCLAALVSEENSFQAAVEEKPQAARILKSSQHYEQVFQAKPTFFLAVSAAKLPKLKSIAGIPWTSIRHLGFNRFRLWYLHWPLLNMLLGELLSLLLTPRSCQTQAGHP